MPLKGKIFFKKISLFSPYFSSVAHYPFRLVSLAFWFCKLERTNFDFSCSISSLSLLLPLTWPVFWLCHLPSCSQYAKVYLFGIKCTSLSSQIFIELPSHSQIPIMHNKWWIWINTGRGDRQLACNFFPCILINAIVLLPFGIIS